MTHAVGLSIGATRFAGVRQAHAPVIRQSVLTLFRHRPPELGVPAENPHLNEPGIVVNSFTERVGDPVGIVAADGSIHRGEVLVADALRTLLLSTGRGAPNGSVTVAYPAHWPSSVVNALRGALAETPEWFTATPVLVPDAVCAIAALQSRERVPTRGVVAVCDFGGSGTSITLLDAADGYRPIGPTVRHTDFSGDLIDQSLTAHVLADLAAGGSPDGASTGGSSMGGTGTSALGALTRLRAECRGAKERLSQSVGTALHADVPGFRGDVRLTRQELDDEIREPLAGVVAALRKTMERDGVRPNDLSAVVSIGGGAAIPAVTTTLSQHLRVPILTEARPELTAAVGASVRAARPVDDKPKIGHAPVIARAGSAALADRADASPQSSTLRALAWSEAYDVAPVVGAAGLSSDDDYDQHDYDELELVGAGSVRPELRFEAGDGPPLADRMPWYRRPPALLGAATGVFFLLSMSVVIALGSDTPPVGTHSQVSPSTAPAVPASGPVGDAPPPPTRTVFVAEPPPQTIQAPKPAAVPVPAPRLAPAPAPRSEPPAAPAPAPRSEPPAAPVTTPPAAPPTTQVPPPPTTPAPPPPSPDPPTTPPPPDPPTTQAPPPPPPTTQAPPPQADPPPLQPPFTIPPIPTVPPIPMPDIPGLTVPLIPQG